MFKIFKYLSCVLLLSSISCSDSKKGGVLDRQLNSYSFDESTYVFDTGEEIDLKNKVDVPNFDSTLFVWKTSNEHISTVSSNGILKCLSPGTTKISLFNKQNSIVATTDIIIRGLEIKIDSYSFHLLNHLEEPVDYRIIDSVDSINSSFITTTGDNIIKSYKIYDSNAIINFEYTNNNNKTYASTYTANISDDYKISSVHDIKYTEKSEDIIHLHGIIVKSYYSGTNNNSSYINPEILVKSYESEYDDYIGINCSSFSLMSSENYLLGFNSGDEVIMDVKITQPNLVGERDVINSDYGKKIINLNSNNIIKLSSNNNYSLNIDNAIKINTFSDLYHYFSRSDYRQAMFYKLFRFKANSRYALSGKNQKSIHIGMENNNSENSVYYIDRMVPAFYTENATYTLKNKGTYESLLLDDGVKFTAGDFTSDKFISKKTVYAMYVGGRGTYLPYHNFVIFGEEYVI